MNHPELEDLVFQQFETLLEHFVKIAKINTKEQRMDSTNVMPNIKKTGRLALAYDVLKQAIEACPAELLSEMLKKLPSPPLKTMSFTGREAVNLIQGSRP
ncbi:MAG: hypothetical protein ACYC0Q_01620 [Eubacteriales bacterium]